MSDLFNLTLDISTHSGIYWTIALYMFLFVTLLWIIGLFQNNHSLIDGFYGSMYAVAGWAAFLMSGANSMYAGLLLMMVSLHGFRLGFYLLRRWFGYRKHSKGDARYQGFVTRFSPGYWWKSFFVVMQPQTVVIMLIGMPTTFGIMINGDSHTGINLLGAIGMLIFGIGTYYEWLADGQLQAFKQDPANKGRYTEFGVWRLTRHPNYFGNTCVWWGIYLTALAGNPDAWWTIIGPVVNTIMLTKVLGTAFQDKHMGSRPEYAELIRRTSGFFPRPPRD